MAQYVDGYVIPIKKSKLKAYKKMATLGCKTWMKHATASKWEMPFDMKRFSIAGCDVLVRSKK